MAAVFLLEAVEKSGYVLGFSRFLRFQRWQVKWLGDCCRLFFAAAGKSGYVPWSVPVFTLLAASRKHGRALWLEHVVHFLAQGKQCWHVLAFSMFLGFWLPFQVLNFK